jgi:hypothetical protein
MKKFDPVASCQANPAPETEVQNAHILHQRGVFELGIAIVANGFNPIHRNKFPAQPLMKLV